MGRVLGIAIWVITILSVLMFTTGRWWFPASISEHGPAVDRQFMITIIVVGISFAAAQIGLGWAVWKYRDTAAAQRATYSHGNNRLEVIWTVVTAIVFISLAVMGQRVWASAPEFGASGLLSNRSSRPAVRMDVSLPRQGWSFWTHGPVSD